MRRDEAVAWIRETHRHHRVAPAGWLFALGLEVGGELRGVAIVGRPLSRHLDDGITAEVLRVAVVPPGDGGPPSGCSRLYGACARAARELGYARIVTYILASEPGTSLRAAGWARAESSGGGGTWKREGRSSGTPPLLRLALGDDPGPTCPKVRWEKILTAPTSA